MFESIRVKPWWALGALSIVLAGCASVPAPVVNHSFGGTGGAASGTGGAPSAASAPGAQTFGLHGHANGTTTPAGYTVARGDTLYSIAFAHGMDVREIAALNAIAPPYVIHPGQVLKLHAGAASAPASEVATAPVAPPSPHPTHAQPPSTPVFEPVATQPEPSAPAAPSGPVFGPVTAQPMSSGGVAEAPSAPESSGASAPVATEVEPPVVTAPHTAPTGKPAAVEPAPVPQVVAPMAPAAVAPAASADATPPPGATRSVAGVTWRWPASGKVVSGFTAGQGGDGAGLDIAGKLGDPVRAAAEGTVVYSGNGLIGYGELIIIKHNDSYLSAYGHNSKRLVKEGQHVSAGEEIALMGASGAPRVELHFEIRKDGKPVDPAGFLPKR